MISIASRGRPWARGLVGVVCLLVPALASANVWQATFGQRWFYESAAVGQPLAGTWWEGALEPGTTYTASFRVNNVNGAMGVFMGNLDMVRVDAPGPYSFDFTVSAGNPRRMMFMALGGDASAGVSQIAVVPRTAQAAVPPPSPGEDDAPSGDGGSTSMPRGHYLTFARERDLKAESLDLIDNPSRAPSNWHMGIAQDIYDALSLSAIEGFAVEVDWRTVETGDGVYDWDLIDANMAYARRLGKKFIVNVATRSFDGENPMPRYFPSQYAVWYTQGGKTGYVAKLWDPWVYNRLIRLFQRIAERYGSDDAFGGIATSETAIGTGNGNYSVSAYKQALVQIVTQTEAALTRGKLFWYLNFIRGGDRSDMRFDARVDLVRQVPHGRMAIGAPDITPDVPGMPGGVNAYRIHVRKTMGDVEQFCHLQHVDQGWGNVNRKTNENRRRYAEQVTRQRQRESQSWYSGQPAIFEFSELANGRGAPVQMHPDGDVGDLWHPSELLQFANRNFDCDYVFWHYRENVHNNSTQFWWEDIRPVILNDSHAY